MMNLLPLLLLVVFQGCQATDDPCLDSNHASLNDPLRSTGSKVGVSHDAQCDDKLTEGWYRFTSPAGGNMPDSCVPKDHCTTQRPLWLKGGHPAVKDGIVTRDACANMAQDSSCCEYHMDIRVKNCSSFSVYYLKPLPFCSMAYCAGNRTPCPADQTSVDGFSPCSVTTSNPPTTSPQSSTKLTSTTGTPSSVMTSPVLSNPEVQGHTFRFTCSPNMSGPVDPNMQYEVQWLFNGQPDPSVPNEVISGGSKPEFHLPGTSLRNHLGTEIQCSVRAFSKFSAPNEKGTWKLSNKYWAGITVEPQTHRVSETGKNDTVVIKSTVPVVCDSSGDPNSKPCCLHFIVETTGPRKNLVVPNQCQVKICSSDWNPLKHQASTILTVKATTDLIRDGDKRVSLALKTLQHLGGGGGGAYFSIFSNYSIPAVQITVVDARTFRCSWTGDPHFTMNNYRRFDLYHVGAYTVYEHTEDNFEIQMQTIRCNRIASCQCGLAIREQGDVIRLSNCHNTRYAPRIETANQQLRPGTSVHRSRDGRNIMIYLPSGREVRVDVGRFYQTVHLTMPASDVYHGRGMCGSLTGDRHYDFLHRDGSQDPNPCRSHRSYYHCLASAFSHSWSTSSSTSLFSHIPNLATSSQSNQYCQCDGASSSQNSINCSPAAQVPYRAQRCGCHSCHDVTSDLQLITQSRWGKRNAIYGDYDEPDPPVVFEDTHPENANLSFPTPSGISESAARAKCQSQIQSSQLYAHCQGLDSFKQLEEGNLEDCVADILMMDSLDLAEAAQASFSASCQQELLQDPANYRTTQEGDLTLKEHLTQVCSLHCLQHGTCQEGGCVCEPGYWGDTCQLKTGSPPILKRLRGPNFCDLAQRPCRTLYFDADNFEITDTFKCRVETGSGDPLEVKATFVSGDRLSCSLPDIHNEAESSVWVSVTVDGEVFSNKIKVTVFDSTCKRCTQEGCSQKSKTCLIGNQCHQDGDRKADDTRMMCNVSATTSQWSQSTSDAWPVVDGATVTGPDSHLMMRCGFRSVFRGPSVRFRVTWLTAGGQEVGREVVEGDQREGVKSLMDFHPFGSKLLSIQCRVTPFFEGESELGPTVTSEVKTFQIA